MDLHQIQLILFSEIKWKTFSNFMIKNLFKKLKKKRKTQKASPVYCSSCGKVVSSTLECCENGQIKRVFRKVSAINL